MRRKDGLVAFSLGPPAFTSLPCQRQVDVSKRSPPPTRFGRTSITGVMVEKTLQQAPAGEFIDVDGVRLHYKIGGDVRNNSVILLHGASGSLLDFTYSDAHFKALTRVYRVLAFDRPGLGFSAPCKHAQVHSLDEQARLMREAAAKLGITHPVLVGHSYGTSVALAWAIAAPRSVRGLVLISGVVRPFAPIELSWLYRLVMLPLVGPVASLLVQTLVSREYIQSLIEAIFAPQRPPPRYFTHVVTARTVNADVYRNNVQQVAMLAAEMEKLRPRLVELKNIPIWLISGDEDLIVAPESQSITFAEEFDNAQLIMLHGVGHMPHHVRPDDCFFAPLHSIFSSQP